MTRRNADRRRKRAAPPPAGGAMRGLSALAAAAIKLPLANGAHDEAAPDPLRPWLLAGLTALLVARPLMPSEDAAWQGDGLPLIMLWIVLAVMWLLGVIGRPAVGVRFGRVDAALLLVVGLYGVAALVAVAAVPRRPPVNMLWEWVGFGLVLLMTRQLVVRPAECRAVVAVLVVLGACVAAYGLYDCYVEMPRKQARYQANPDAVLRENEVNYPPGSPQRMRFETRLADREPLGSFSLTNSLAAFLVAPLTAGAVIALGAWRRRPGRRSWAVVAAWLLPIAVTLVLTRSRSAYVAAVVGLGLAWWTQRPAPAVAASSRRSGRMKWLVAAVLAVVVLAAAGWGLSPSGRPVLDRAGKSLRYRFEYWEATVAMIADHPLLGVGPANFQDFYTRYKAPQASEEPVDPHNFLLEIAATAGLPALLVFAATLLVFGLRAGRLYRASRTIQDDDEPEWANQKGLELGSESPLTPNPSPARGEGSGSTDGHPLWVLGGAMAGLAAAPVFWFNNPGAPSFALLALAIPTASAAFFTLWPWVRGGRLPAPTAAIAAGAMLVCLLAGGGIGYPAVAANLWLLLALGLNADGQEPWKTLRRGWALGLLAAGLLLALACYETAYAPVLYAQADRLRARRQPLQAQELLLAAAKADPLDSRPWQELAGLAVRQWTLTGDQAWLKSFTDYRANTLRRQQNSALTWDEMGQLEQQIFGKSKSPEWVQAAVGDLRRAVQLYPHNAAYHARLALALRDAGDTPGFQTEAREALRLDALMPHEDRKLPAELRDALQRSNKL